MYMLSKGNLSMKRKLNYKNIVLMIVMLICAGFVLGDTISIFLIPAITGYGITFSWLGFVLYFGAYMIAGVIFEYFKEKID